MNNYYPNKVIASMSMELELGPPSLPYKQMPIEKQKEMRAELEAVDYFKWLKEDPKTKKSSQYIIMGTIGAVVLLVIISFFVWRQLRKEKIEENLLDNNQ